MTALANYSTGTVSVAAGDTIVSGVGTIWSSTNVRPGDILQIGNFQTIITDVTDPTHLVIPPWGGGAQAAVAYVVWKVSSQRIAGAQAMADVSTLVAALNTTGFFWFVDVSLAAPDPSLGSDGQYALQPSTGKMWFHAGGAWSYLGIYRGFNFRGVYDNAATYAVGDVQTTAGTSYVWINATPGSGHTAPDGTYWQVLAAKGDKGDTGAVPWSNTTAWATATNYVAAPPTSIVVHPINKNIYQCVVPHLSGNFATDLAAGKWLLIGQSATEATSATALAIGAGTKVFSAVTGFSYQNGVRLRASSNASPTNWMEGVCLYDPIAQIITMTVDKTAGAGTFGDWNFNRVGQPGAGDLTSSLNLSDLTSKPAAVVNLGIPALLRGHLSGLKITSTGAATFTVSAGVACDRNQLDMIALNASMTKTSAAWSVGTGNGCLDTGTLTSGFYHVFVIKHPLGVVDILMSLSATAPTLPSGYTMFRRIGAVWWSVSSTFLQILQRAREFWWPGVALDMDTALGSTLQTYTLGSIPPGVQVQAILTVIGWCATQNTQWWVHDVAAVDTAPNFTNGATATEVTTVSMGNFSEIRVWTNTLRQVAARASAAGVTLRIITRGWYDPLE
ncbi:hypothetical protein [Bradyrhizobium erythrophlei]|uniref:Uncharacterized protein n=1 Tax=Bradyrhizobium erythrophlei TaxID=1437360 RepID=A0A1H4NYL6_9BRAD|nr:hypothetical protein [Bradyrhizobium erythrophlei]SEB99938.1 hypothetical protein SAMN05444164_0762 [Bradyrhizobium erythrophlei]